MENRKKRIGLLIDHLVSEYNEILVQGLIECGRKMKVDMFVFEIGELNNTSDNYDYQYVAARALVTQNNLDGVIFVSSIQSHYISPEKVLEYVQTFEPLKIVNIAGQLPGVTSIVSEYDQAYYTLIEHLIRDVKARKFMIVSVKSQSDDVVRRERIIRDVFKKYKINYDDQLIIKASFGYAVTRYELIEYARNNPDDKFNYDAAITLNDSMATATIDFLQEKGIRVPEDIAVIGFDDMRNAYFNQPSISTVNQRIFHQSYVGARTLCDILLDKEVPLVQKIEGKAVLRESSGAARYFNIIQNCNLIEIDRASMAGFTNEYSAFEWYKKRSQLFRMSKNFMDAQTQKNPDEMIERMNFCLESFAVPFVAVVAYDKPVVKKSCFETFDLPKKAKVLMYSSVRSDLQICYDEAVIAFNPNDSILPEGLLNFGENPLLVIPLFVMEKQYGYLVIEMADLDVAIFDLIGHSVSNLLSLFVDK